MSSFVRWFIKTRWQVIVNYKAAGHHKWAREQLGKEVGWCSCIFLSTNDCALKVRKLAAGTTWADVAGEFIVKAVVMNVESSAGIGNNVVKVLCVPWCLYFLFYFQNC